MKKIKILLKDMVSYEEVSVVDPLLTTCLKACPSTQKTVYPKGKSIQLKS